MKTMKTMKHIFAGAIMCAFSLHTYAANYYVSVTGNDSNNGSQASPWRNISKAIASVPANAGHVINIGAGTFTESNYIYVPSGVSIIGAGSKQTKILVNKYFDLETTLNDCSGQGGRGWNTSIDQFVIQIASGSNQTFRGFAMDGQGRKNHGGIYMETGTKIIFDDLDIQNFKFTGLWVHNSVDTEVMNCYLKDNCYGTGGQDAGNIMFHANTNLLIHDNYILETGVMGGKGGYGIKSYAKWHNNACFWQEWDRNWNSTANGMKIYNNTIIVPSLGTWLAGGNAVPDITIEFNSIGAVNCEIYNNNLNNHISLIGHGANNANSFNVHHNFFNLGNEYRYTMEADAHGIEFHHNYVVGGNYPLAIWGNNATVYNLRLHHNVFYATVPGLMINADHQEYSGFKFYNNTVYDTQGISNIFGTSGGDGKYSNVDIRNNLFIGNGAGFTNAGLTGNVSNNGFQGINPYGNSNTTGDMKLMLTGNKPTTFFELQASSPAVNAGAAIAGYTDGSVGNPDLGAFEYGVAAWTVGPKSLGPVAVTGVGISPVTNTMYVGEKLSLMASVSPANATNAKVTYMSDKPAFATVSATGEVTAVAEGVAIITATTEDGNKKATSTITVTKRVGLFIEAETYTTMNGVLNKGTVVGNTDDGTWLKFSAIDFKSGYSKLTTRLAVDAAYAGETVEFRIDAADGTLIASLTPASTGSWTTYTNQMVNVTANFTGVHDLYVLFKAALPARGVGDFDWFGFTEPKVTTGIDVTNYLGQNIYPNPTKNKVFFKQANTAFSLYSLTGNMLEGGVGAELNLEEYPAGTYMLKTAEGFTRIIKE